MRHVLCSERPCQLQFLRREHQQCSHPPLHPTMVLPVHGKVSSNQIPSHDPQALSQAAQITWPRPAPARRSEHSNVQPATCRPRRLCPCTNGSALQQILPPLTKGHTSRLSTPSSHRKATCLGTATKAPANARKTPPALVGVLLAQLQATIPRTQLALWLPRTTTFLSMNDLT